MTLVLDLTPDLESRLQAEAARQSQDPADYALQLLDRTVPRSGTAFSHSERLSLIRAIQGKYADAGFVSEDLQRDRIAEVQREETQYRRDFRPTKP